MMQFIFLKTPMHVTAQYRWRGSPLSGRDRMQQWLYSGWSAAGTFLCTATERNGGRTGDGWLARQSLGGGLNGPWPIWMGHNGFLSSATASRLVTHMQSRSLSHGLWTNGSMSWRFKCTVTLMPMWPSSPNFQYSANISFSLQFDHLQSLDWNLELEEASDNITDYIQFCEDHGLTQKSITMYLNNTFLRKL